MVLDWERGAVGSLQVYTSHNCSAEDVACSLFSVDQVHRIGLLDVRLLNKDRHVGNILLNYGHLKGEDKMKLIPIDHGLCLPTVHEMVDGFNLSFMFAWMDWPQAKEPFTKETITYIKHLDIDQDIKTGTAALESGKEKLK